MPKIYPVIMSGGAGSRLWPISKKSSPKQYHALITQQTMFAETLVRLTSCDDTDVAPPIVICAKGHEQLVAAQSQSLGIELTAIILEPMARNTAAVGAIAATYVQSLDPDALTLLLPADHHIEDSKGFWTAVNKASEVADQGYLATLGIRPTGPETGFGYICRGDLLAPEVYKITSFREKPDLGTAKTYLQSGDYFWNAGIFLFNNHRLMSDYKTHAPDILRDCQIALEKAEVKDLIVSLDTESFEKCRSDSIDYAIMEKTDFAAIVAPVDVGWHDLGSWSAIRDLSQSRGSLENVSIGDVELRNCQNTLVRSDGPFVAALGIQDIVIIATEESVLVSHIDHTQDVKTVVNHLIDTDRHNLL